MVGMLAYIDKNIKLNNIAKLARELEEDRNIPDICTICGDTNALRKMKVHLKKKINNLILARLNS